MGIRGNRGTGEMFSYRRWRLRAISGLLTGLVCLLAATPAAHSATVTSLGDHGNVTVMEFDGNYDVNMPDGTGNDEPRRLIATEFFKSHQDVYDFLVIFSNFEFLLSDADTLAVYHGVKNDVQGIGLDLFDYTASYGSAGTLQGLVDMGNIMRSGSDPLDREFEVTLENLSHEILHRWSSHLHFVDPAGNVSDALLGVDWSHWSFLLDTGGSLQYGNDWIDNGNGTFTAVGSPRYYSPLDLYVMGFIDKSEVPPILLIENPDVAPDQLPHPGATITGSATYVSVDDIVAAEGERVPSAADSQKEFSAAFILITRPGTYTGEELSGLENVRNGFVTRFSLLTDGKGVARVAPKPIDAVPGNPGVPPPVVDPRTVPPSVEDAVTWLLDHQQVDGSWVDSSQTSARDTTEAARVLHARKDLPTQAQAAVDWLVENHATNTDYLARVVETLHATGQDGTTMLEDLLSRQNSDGGWGSEATFDSNVVDTALVLKTLAKVKYGNGAVIARGTEYLRTRQNTDGGWGEEGGSSFIQPTADALVAFHAFSDVPFAADMASGARGLLLAKQNPDGGFGNSPSTVYDTATAVLALKETLSDAAAIAHGVEFLSAEQSADGSWYVSAYQTALAAQAVWSVSPMPDLTIDRSGISAVPPSIKGFPADIVLNASVRNHGGTDVALATVALYQGAGSAGMKIGEETVAVPAGSAAVVSFAVHPSGGEDTGYTVVVDAENGIEEFREDNNTAGFTIPVEETFDFVIADGDVTVTPESLTISEEIAISARVTNRGTADALGMLVRFFLDDPAGPLEIGTMTTDLAAGETKTLPYSWKANRAGNDLRIGAQANPAGTYWELSTENNTGFAPVTVTAPELPNLVFPPGALSVSPDPVLEGKVMNAAALLRNDGFAQAADVGVSLYAGFPDEGGTLIHTWTHVTLEPGAEQILTFTLPEVTWFGRTWIYVEADREGAVEEISTIDNTAFISIAVLSLPDLEVSPGSIALAPPLPKQGDPVNARVTIRNLGDQEVLNVTVRATRGTTVVETIVPAVPGHAQFVATLPLGNPAEEGTERVLVTVDPENTLREAREDNNGAEIEFGVQNADLAVSERYISPDGDGVQDSTDFSCRVSVSEPVEIIVVDGSGERIRSLTGSLGNFGEGTYTWDGRTDRGMLADDGRYRILIVGESGAVYGDAPVTVDTNRSPLTDALGTDYLKTSNVTCHTPALAPERWEWAAGDAEIVFSVYRDNGPDAEVPAGVYSISSLGGLPSRIVPPEWTSHGSDVRYDGYIAYAAPLGDNVAFTVHKTIPANPVMNTPAITVEELWVTDVMGSDYSVILADEEGFIDTVEWAPDGGSLLYNANGEFWLVNLATLATTQIDSSSGPYHSYFYYPAWSADGTRLAYATGYYGPRGLGDFREDVRLVDLGGPARVFETFMDETLDGISWLGNGTILVRSGKWEPLTTLTAYDADNGDGLVLSSSVTEVVVGHLKGRAAFIDTDEQMVEIRVRTVTADRSTEMIHHGPVRDLLKANGVGRERFQNLFWDSDDRTLVWTDHAHDLVYKAEGCPPDYVPYIAVYDGKTKSLNEHIVGVAACRSYECSYSGIPECQAVDQIPTFHRSLFLLDDDRSLVIETWAAYSLFDIRTGERGGDLPVKQRPKAYPQESPRGNRISSYRHRPLANACSGPANYREDLWTVSSLLNLTADLRIEEEDGAAVLKGTAQDLNFAGYRVEARRYGTEEPWSLVVAPSNLPALDEEFGTFYPPSPDAYWIRLVVWDKAGNVVEARRTLKGSPTADALLGAYVSDNLFSPNGDGVRDSVKLIYSVSGPFQSEAKVLDERDVVVNSFPVSQIVEGTYEIFWDGRDREGNVVPDGNYRITFEDRIFGVAVDATPPEAYLDCSFESPTIVDPLILAGIGAAVDDENLEHWDLEIEDFNPNGGWFSLNQAERKIGIFDYQTKRLSTRNPLTPVLIFNTDSILVGRYAGEENNPAFPGQTANLVEPFLQEVTDFKMLLGLPARYPEEISGHTLRLTARDLAGNTTLAACVPGLRSGLILFDMPPDYVYQGRLNPAGGDGQFISGLCDAVGCRITAEEHNFEVFLNSPQPIHRAVLVVHQEQIVDGDAVVFEDEVAEALDPENGRLIMNWDGGGWTPLPNAYPVYLLLKVEDVYGNVAKGVPALNLDRRFGLAPLCDNGIPGAPNYELWGYEFSDNLRVRFWKLGPPKRLIQEFPAPPIEWTRTGGVSFIPGVDPKYMDAIEIVGSSNGREKSAMTEQFPSACSAKVNVSTRWPDTVEFSGVPADVVHLEASTIYPEKGTNNFRVFLSGPGTGSTVLAEIENPPLLPEMAYANDLSTRTMAEGRYTFGAELASENGLPVTKTSEFLVDHTPPNGSVLYPRAGDVMCVNLPADATIGFTSEVFVPLRISYSDNFGVMEYRLKYREPGFTEEWEIFGSGRPKAGKTKQGEAETEHIIAVRQNQDLIFGLDVIDGYNNMYSTQMDGPFRIDLTTGVNITGVTEALISPNGDGVKDQVRIDYLAEDTGTVDVRIYGPLTTEMKGDWRSAPLARDLYHGSVEANVENASVWDGHGNGGTVVEDGTYAVAIFMTDTCSHTAVDTRQVYVDTTPPTVAIDETDLALALARGSIVEIRGTVQDALRADYRVEIGEGTSPAGWEPLSEGTGPVESDRIGRWNTADLTGLWTVRLSAVDAAGNGAETTVVAEISRTATLIRDLLTEPAYVSPNGDGVADLATIGYELGETCNLLLTIADGQSPVRTLARTGAIPGRDEFLWDGLKDDGGVAADGLYAVTLKATLVTNETVVQEESVSLVVDSTAPIMDVTYPKSESFSGSAATVTGSVLDENMDAYELSIAGAAAILWASEGVESREDYDFGTVQALDDGPYSLNAKAIDRAGNRVEIAIPFTVDTTAPAIRLDEPAEGDLFGTGRQELSVVGGIVEENPGTWVVRVGQGDDPSDWTVLGSGDVPAGDPEPGDPFTFTLPVGPSAGVADGVYTVSVLANDRAGLETETRKAVIVDNTPPEAVIDSPSAGSFITSKAAISGTAYDLTFKEFTIDASSGACGQSAKWMPIGKGDVSVTQGKLASWNALPPDGEYCLRLTVQDRLENTARAEIPVTVDTHPPGPPVLSGTAASGGTVELSWSESPEADVVGYLLLRGGVPITSLPVTDTTYTDGNLPEGIYTYTVVAVDRAGLTSVRSNPVELEIDTTGPTTRIRAPRMGDRVTGLVEIQGTAYSSDDFREYRVFVGFGEDPAAWDLIRKSPVPMPFGLFTPWDTRGLDEGAPYSIRLEAEDLTGNVGVDQLVVTVDNTPPAAPTIVDAVQDGAVPTTVYVNWLANTEPDLRGYLVYRNGRIANADGPVVGELYQYVLTDTEYRDEALPDGTFRYTLVALDRAGNMSGPSDPREVLIDTRPPHAVIVDPVEGTRFDSPLVIRAQSEDEDLATVQFQFRSLADGVWTNLGEPVGPAPFRTILDPALTGLVYGDYQLRAVAADSGGKTDPAPVPVTVYYADVTGPGAPTDLAARTNGPDVALTWLPPGAGDALGYYVYRADANGVKTRITSNPVDAPAFTDAAVPDGSYRYEVTGLDAEGNESTASNPASALVYAPMLDQVATPVQEPIIRITGRGAQPNSAVEIFVDTGSGSQSRATAQADGSGVFGANLSLSLGENRISAEARDDRGNVSRRSEKLTVLYNEAPAVPQGLVATVEGFDVNLTWLPNTEEDLAGYYVYRDGLKINPLEAISGGTGSASDTWYGDYSDVYDPQNGLDADPWTYWASSENEPGPFVPIWYEAGLSAPARIEAVEILWAEFQDYSGTPWMSARDFEVQVRSGEDWIPVASVAGNVNGVTSVSFTAPQWTAAIRIFMTATNDIWLNQVGIAEVELQTAQPVSRPEFDDPGLSDGRYRYAVSAVDVYGLESGLSDETVADVGDVIPPSAPSVLAATVDGSNVTLDWSAGPSPDPDLAGYNVYRLEDTSWIGIAESVTDTVFVDEDLPNGTYRYRVTASDTVGNESAPSPEAEVLVDVSVPDGPLDLAVEPLPAGGTLRAMWTPAALTPAGYALYRSLVSGGPYERVNAAPIGDSQFDDTGLVNGTTYFYIVVAVDAAGNESVPSNEAAGVPADTLPPRTPILFGPTIASVPLTVYAGNTDVTGKADPGFTVVLTRDGRDVATTIASAKDQDRTFSPDTYTYEAELSPDGGTLANVDYNGLWLVNLSTGEKIGLGDGGEISWSPDGNRLLYTFYDAAGYGRITIYEKDSGLASTLTNDTDVDEYEAAWSRNGRFIAFVSTRLNYDGDVWIKDLKTGEFFRAPGSTAGDSPIPAPNGTRVACDTAEGLVVIDWATGETITVAPNAAGGSHAWSADGGELFYVTYEAGIYQIRSVETAGWSERLLVQESSYVYRLQVSPAGDEIGYLHWGTDYQWSLVAVSAVDSGPARVLAGPGGYLANFSWSASGELVYGSDILHIVMPAGTFVFTDLDLVGGENLFGATALDAAGNASQPAEEIAVYYDTSLLPDLETTVDDLYVYPNAPLEGNPVTLHAVVWNRGSGVAENVAVDLYVVEAGGTVALIRSATIPSIAPGEADVVSADWEAAGHGGINTIMAVIDPLDRIGERRETNNFAMKTFYVAGAEGISAETTLDRIEYVAFQDMTVQVVARNSGDQRSITVETVVEDAEGTMVVAVGRASVTLEYGNTEEWSFVWNTEARWAGLYAVHTIVRDETGTVLVEERVPFTIWPETIYGGNIAADKSHYGPNETVSLEYNATNGGRNVLLENATARVAITDPYGVSIPVAEREIPFLMPETSARYSSAWNTGSAVPGDYEARLELIVNGETVAVSRGVFTVDAHLDLAGKVAITPNVVPAGGTVTGNATVQANGNVGGQRIGLAMTVFDGKTGAQLNSWETVFDIGSGEERVFSNAIPTIGFGPGEFMVRLRATVDGTGKDLDEQQFRVVDVVPPSITATTPEPGRFYGADVAIGAIVRDDASGVGVVEFSVDQGLWQPMTEVSGGAYASRWTAGAGADGSHDVVVRAVDCAGNLSRSEGIAFMVDLTPPTTLLSVGDPKIEEAGNVTVTFDTLFSFDASDGGSGVARTEYRIDGSSWSSAGTFNVSTEGVHTIWYRAVDRVGNVETERPFVVEVVRSLDDTPPVTTIDVGEPRFEGDRLYVSNHTEFALTASDQISGVAKTEYRFDGGDWAAYGGPFTVAKEGPVTIGYRSTDGMENVEDEHTLSVVVDMTPPVSTFSASPELLPDILNVVSGRTVFSLDATDALSGLRELSYRIDDGPWHSAESARFTLMGEEPGGHSIFHTPVDKVDNAEEETSVNVRLVDVTATKKIDITPSVLIWGHCHGDDNSDPNDGDDSSHEDDGHGKQPCNTVNLRYEDETGDESHDDSQHCDSLRALQEMLKQGGIDHATTSDREEFTGLLRSGRFNVYLLLDRTDETIAEELSATVYGGAGTVMLDPPPDGLGALEEVFDVKTRGMSRQAGLTVVLEESPLRITGELLLGHHQKAVRATLRRGEASVVGFVTEGRREHPVVVLNTFGNGAAAYVGFDPTASIDRGVAADLLQGAIGFVMPNQAVAGALQAIPVRVDLVNSTEPVFLRVTEIIPPGMTVEGDQPPGLRTQGNISWDLELVGAEQASIRYRALIPDGAGDHSVDSDIRYRNGEEYFPLTYLSLNLGSVQSRTNMLSDLLGELRLLEIDDTADKQHRRKAIRALVRIESNAEGRVRIERNIEQVLEAIREISHIQIDTGPARQRLSELLLYWQRVWSRSVQGKGKPES